MFHLTNFFIVEPLAMCPIAKKFWLSISLTVCPHHRATNVKSYTFSSVGACNLILHIHVVVNWQLSKQGICWPISHDHTVGSGVNPLRSHFFLVIHWQVTSFQLIACSIPSGFLCDGYKFIFWSRLSILLMGTLLLVMDKSAFYFSSSQVLAKTLLLRFYAQRNKQVSKHFQVQGLDKGWTIDSKNLGPAEN